MSNLDPVYYVTISTARQIPFINRRGPITSKISMKKSTIDTLKAMGFDVKIISEVNLDKNGKQYADDASKFVPADNQSESNVDVNIVDAIKPNDEEIFSGSTEGLEAKKDDLSHSQQEEETPESEEEVDDTQEKPAEESTEEEEDDDFSLESYETYEKWNATKLKAYISDTIIPRLEEEDVPDPIPTSKKDCLAFLKTLLDE
ncbi:g130 [Yersinia phage phiR1-37]|uniref:hypothetical protein n=1 Tax=Yersinia phage phiR1-37 TaxID=331278 RepID=UPI00022DBD2E|nr:hypothetical protein phiR1-37_gp130 [Yersinia phage phiR1-37]CCE26154.1 g130 [Yersinia phage phiR1-37]